MSPSPVTPGVPVSTLASSTCRLLAAAGATLVVVATALAASVLSERPDAASAYTPTWTAHHQGVPNPVLPPGCGLDVGLLIDRSGSIARAGAEEKMRTAARTFVDALAGTPSRLGIWSFGATSAATPGDPDHPAALLTDLGGSDIRSRATALQTTISSIPFVPEEATNWDAAFRAVHQASVTQHEPPDLLVVFTDGHPTVNGDASSDGSRTDDADIDAGIVSANLVKADGTRIFAVGIGADIDTPALSSISGTTSWDGTNLASADYATTSFDELAATLHGQVSDLCGGTVTVQKVIRDGARGERPEAGWTFALDAPTHPAWATSKVTDENGMVQFSVSSAAVERVTIHEVGRVGVRLLPEEILCNNTSGLQPVLQRDERGITFDLGPRDVIACTFPNLLEPTPVPTSPTTQPQTVVSTAPPTTAPPVTGPPAEASPPTAPPSTAAQTDAPGAEPTPAEILPRTGADSGRLVAAGICLLLGGGLVTLGLRRSPDRT